MKNASRYKRGELNFIHFGVFMKAPLLFSALIILLISELAFAASPVKLPAGYEPILRCEAAMRAPEFKVARKDGEYYLAAKVGSKTALYLLEVTSGDSGYTIHAPANPEDLGDLQEHVQYVSIRNNDEEIENSEDAVHTGGRIRGSNLTDQECEVTGEPRVYPIE